MICKIMIIQTKFKRKRYAAIKKIFYEYYNTCVVLLYYGDYKMNIQKIDSARNFGRVIINHKEYEKILEPYVDVLTKLTAGYDVYVREEPPFYAYDKYSDENCYLKGLPSITINPENSANKLIPEMKFIVHPDAEEIQSDSGVAYDLIKIIEKGISFFR